MPFPPPTPASFSRIHRRKTEYPFVIHLIREICRKKVVDAVSSCFLFADQRKSQKNRPYNKSNKKQEGKGRRDMKSGRIMHIQERKAFPSPRPIEEAERRRCVKMPISKVKKKCVKESENPPL